MNLFSKELASRSKAPAITYHRNRWAELGINPSLHDAIDTALTSNRSKIFSHYHQSRFSSSYSNQIFFNFTPPLFSFPIHDDARIKCWTLAYYFYPESNSGTILYDSNKRRVYDAEWTPKIGLSFCH